HYCCVAAVDRARPRPLALPRLPPPPLVAPRLALPPPVSLIPRVRLLVVVRPAVSSLAVKFSVHSPNWSLKLLSWLLICARFDHRNSPAAAAPAAAAAAASGRSRAMSITPQSLYWLRPLGLLFRPPLLRARLLLLGIVSLLVSDFAVEPF